MTDSPTPENQLGFLIDLSIFQTYIEAVLIPSVEQFFERHSKTSETCEALRITVHHLNALAQIAELDGIIDIDVPAYLNSQVDINGQRTLSD